MSEAAPISTTHVGSLPRPQDVVDLAFAEDRDETIDRAEYGRVVGEAVRDRVRHQVDAGIDLVSDGEMSKSGYATYIRHRLSGFEVGDVPRATPADLDAYPRFRDRLAREGGSARYLRPICRGPITYENSEPVQQDLARLKAAIDGQPVSNAFMNAPSPGIIALFAPNEYYDALEEYLEAIGEAMKVEYEAIVAAGVQLQIDAPDLAMGRHIMYRERSDDEFVSSVGRHVEAINRALRDIPAERVRMHLCWGNYEGPHHLDIELRKIIDVILRAKPSTILFEAAKPAPRARAHRVAGGVASRGHDPRSGRHRLDHELHRASRAGRAADPQFHRDRRTRARRGRDRLWLRDVVGIRRDRSRHLLGQAPIARRGARIAAART